MKLILILDISMPSTLQQTELKYCFGIYPAMCHPTKPLSLAIKIHLTHILPGILTRHCRGRPGSELDWQFSQGGGGQSFKLKNTGC